MCMRCCSTAGSSSSVGVQILLVRRRDLVLHRRLGYFGLGLAAVMVVTGVWMSLSMEAWHHDRGSEGALGFLPVPLLDLVIFSVLIAAAGLMRRDPATHKRLVLLATTQLLGAGFGRMELYQIPSTPWLPMLAPLVDLYGMLWLVLAAAVAFDVATRGRPHPAYLAGIPFMLALQVLAVALMVWPGWTPLAKRMLGLG